MTDVVLYFSRWGRSLQAHDRSTLAAVAQAIADVKDCRFAGVHDSRQVSDRPFFVPDDTLTADEASDLGIIGPNDLFGGVVPFPFVKTKAVTHPLIDVDPVRPVGWSPLFADAVRDVVLPGFTVFSIRDARIAAMRLLSRGAVRLKPALASGGEEQVLVATADELEPLLDQLIPEQIATYGLVLELNLHDSATMSVGQITLDGAVITYHGTQSVTADNEGRLVYGGSHLVCVRGGWAALDRLPKPDVVRIGVRQARTYDAAMSAYPGFMASRRNYDVIQGTDGTGRRRSGVLEASWRVGGASTAELAAITTLMRDPELAVVEVSTAKEFGRVSRAPRDAVIHFQGDDPEAGPVVRYTVVTRALRRAA